MYESIAWLFILYFQKSYPSFSIEYPLPKVIQNDFVMDAGQHISGMTN